MVTVLSLLSLLLVHNYGYHHNMNREFKYQNHVNSGIL